MSDTAQTRCATIYHQQQATNADNFYLNAVIQWVYLLKD